MFFDKNKKEPEVKSAHIIAADFSLESELKNKIIEGYGTAKDLPMMRIEQDGKRLILLNTCVDVYDTLLSYLASLDNLPLCVLKDLYKTYLKRYRTLTMANLDNHDLDETTRKMIFVLSIEILWCNGSDVKSRIFS